MNGREKEWSTPKTTFQCFKGSMELGLVRARRRLALLHSGFFFILVGTTQLQRGKTANH